MCRECRGATFSALNEGAHFEIVDRQLLDEEGIAQPVTSADDSAAIAILSVGRAHPGIAVRIFSSGGDALADGHVGEICLQTNSCMLRYHQSARETHRALHGGLLHTGDLGYLRNGELFWVGRVRERITIGGKKMDPSAFEEVLTATPGLREGCFVVFGVPDESIGTERVVVISEVLPSFANNLNKIANTISRDCFLSLGVTPADVMLVRPGTLTKTSSGKRRHRHFRRLYLAGELKDERLQLSDLTPEAICPLSAPQ